MSYGPDFVAILAVACLVIGILIGIAIMVCYKKIVCSVSLADTLPRHHQNTNHTINSIGDRRISDILHGIETISGNPPIGHIVSSQQYLPPSILSDTQEMPEFGPANEGQGNHVTRQRNPSQATFRSNLVPVVGDSNKSHGLNNVNRNTQKSSGTTRSDQLMREGSNRTTNTQMHDNDNRKGSSRNRRLNAEEYEMQVRPGNGDAGLDNNTNTTRGTNSKEPGNKRIPFGISMSARHAFPPEMSTETGKQTVNDNDDYNPKDNIIEDTDLVKMLARCPEDIRTIFRPDDQPSRTIFLREKKIVYVCKMLDENGGLLELKNMGISLYVPPGAIPFKQRNIVTLVLNWDLSDNPLMENKEALVSPVVYCGPHGTTFDKPCILKFKHCAYDTRYARILTSPTDLFDTKSWKEFDKYPRTVETEELVDDDAGDHDYDDASDELPCIQDGVSLGVDECEVEIDHFSLYTCTTRSKNKSLRKWIQIAVFTHDIGPERKHQQIRVYFLNKTPCALQWAIQNEASYGFSLACPDTTFLFTEAGENMVVRVKSVSDGWESVDCETQEPTRTVFFEQIWHGACPHSSMCFRKVDRETEVGRESGKSVQSGWASTGSVSMKEIKWSEINISLSLNQELCENLLSVPLDVLAHNVKLKISDTQVKVIDAGPS